MPSPFVDQLLKPLDLSRPPSPQQRPTHQHDVLKTTPETTVKQTLRSLLVSLNRPLSAPLINDTVASLMQLEPSRPAATSSAADTEENDLKQAILSRLVVGLYSEGLDICISQAMDAETEADWWADVGRSRRNVAWYLVQTLPTRLIHAMHIVAQTLRTQSPPIQLSAFSPASLRHLFPDFRRPNALIKALFPHINFGYFSVTTSTVLFVSKPNNGEVPSFLDRVSSCTKSFFFLTNLPIELGRQECIFKRRELEKIRDERAEALGRLAQVRTTLAAVVKEQSWNSQAFLHILTCIAQVGTPPVYTPSAVPPDSSETLEHTLSEINRLSMVIFTSPQVSYQRLLDAQELRRPSRLTLLWPKILVLPPICIYAIRSAYTSRATLTEVARDAKDTLQGFVRGWLVEPLKEVLKTVRTGGENGVIVRKEGVAADLESLERMTLSLAKDELHYGPGQLATLSQQIKLGDLTPVLQLYEKDIKRPLKSALTGTLLRSVFIQIQKAKVDIDQALAGIDKLLKSQELTFAFVGVAPALAIVYLVGGSLAAFLRGSWGVGKYGGKRRIGGVWSAMRRTERLLISQPGFHHDESAAQRIPPLTTGLLLLSVTRLRRYAETCLPARSRLREGFLEDVGDLENPDLGRAEKMRVVERMWRCWGEVLGWGRVGAEGGRG